MTKEALIEKIVDDLLDNDCVWVDNYPSQEAAVDECKTVLMKSFKTT